MHETPSNGVEISRCKTAWWIWATLAVIVMFAACVRIRLLDQPLERDEGEYAYAGQLMLQGVPPYKLAYNMKLPGTYAAYAVMMSLFGETAAGIHIGLTFVNTATIIMVFLLGRKFFGDIAGTSAAAAYALLSISPSVFGIAAHANHFVVFFALAGILVLLRAVTNENRRTYFLSGLLLGTGFLMKQHGIVFIIFGAIWPLLAQRSLLRRNFRRIAENFFIYALGTIVPLAVTCAWLATAGVFGKFWFWTFVYSSQYASITSVSEGWQNLLSFAHGYAGPTWIFFGMAIVSVFVLAMSNSTRRNRLFLLVFLATSFIGASIGLYFRPHYFILVLPAVALVIGAGIATTTAMLGDKPFAGLLRYSHLPLAVFWLGALCFILLCGNFLFTFDPQDVARRTYPENPFIETVRVAEFIKRNSKPSDQVVVFGSEPQIYFYAHRRSATGYIYMYPFFEPHPFAAQMQQEFMRQLVEARPEFIVVMSGGFRGSWLLDPESNLSLFEWSAKYFDEFYERVGVIDSISPRAVISRWNAEALDYTPQSEKFILVLKRKSIARL
jgi:hypothetical protein